MEQFSGQMYEVRIIEEVLFSGLFEVRVPEHGMVLFFFVDHTPLKCTDVSKALK